MVFEWCLGDIRVIKYLSNRFKILRYCVYILNMYRIAQFGILFRNVYFYFQEPLDEIMGKKVTSKVTTDFTWLLAGDSHVSPSRLLKFAESWGTNTISVSGGMLPHIHAMLNINEFLRRYSRAFVLSFGSNDLTMVSTLTFAEHLMKLVNDLQKENPNAWIITGTIIPRKHAGDSGERFVHLSEGVDQLMKQSAPFHHHFWTDCFQSNPKVPGGPVTVVHQLFHPDGVHLNKLGNEVFRQVLGFVFDSLNFNNFQNKIQIKLPNNALATIAWKF